MLLDTHAHLDYSDYDPDRAAVLARAAEAGVGGVISIGTRLETSRRAWDLTQAFPHLWCAVGIHPCDVGPDSLSQVDGIRELASRPRVAAVGEIGLDYHRLPDDPDEAARTKALQAEAFRAQLELAAGTGHNAVIHQRDSWDDTVAILREFTGRVRGVFHCFGGTAAQAEELFALGHIVSFTGIVTFKNAPVVQQTVRQVPLDRFMVETDCPYLAPVPHRGKRCEPAHARLVAERIAGLRGIPLAEVAAATTATARGFFRLD